VDTVILVTIMENVILKKCPPKAGRNPTLTVKVLRYLAASLTWVEERITSKTTHEIE